jgi:hypothetical protein
MAPRLINSKPLPATDFNLALPTEQDHARGDVRHENDLEDAINLPRWRKLAALLSVSVFAFVANLTSSIIAPALQLWPMAFPQDPKSYSDLSILIAVCTHPH